MTARAEATSQTFPPPPPRAARISDLIGSFSSIRRMLPDLVLATTVINLLGLVLPLALLQVYDRIIPRASLSTLGVLLLGVFLAMALDILVRIGRNYITGWMGARFEHRATCAGFRRLLDTPLAEFERDGASIHQERLRAVLPARDFYSGQALLSLFDLPFTVIYLALIAMIAGKLVFVPVVVLVVFTAVAFYNGRKLKADIARRTQFDERRFSFISDALNGIHTIKGMALEGMMQRRYEMLQDTNAHLGYQGSRHSIMALNIGWLFAQISTVLVVAFGASIVVEGTMTPGALAACLMLAGRSLQPLQGALATWVRLQTFSVARQQLDKLFALPVAPQAGRPPLPDIDGGLELTGIRFAFPKAEKPLFDDLSLMVGPGECVAIIGDSGSGKTTLLSMLAGLAHPDRGRVLVDGLDLSEYATSSLSRQIAYLPQQGILFSGTILENITMFDPALESAAYATAKALGLDRVVAGMRNGYETPVGNTASDAMPGGVKQRIAIARAMARNPRVVLFDEANIAIDSAGDEYLRAYLAGLKGKRTMVLVTHRPSLLKLADRVLAISDGKLVPSSVDAVFAKPAAAEGAAAPTVAERPPVDHRVATAVLSRFRTQTDLSMCLVGLLTALNWRDNPRQLAEALPHVADALDLTGLRRVMANLNYSCRPFRASLAEIDELTLPCLFLPDKGHAKVLLRVEHNGAIAAFDGEAVAITHVEPARAKGTAYVFQPIEAPAKSGERDSWTRRIMGRFRPLVWMGLLITLFTNMLGLATPGFVMLTYDRVLPSGDTAVVPYLAIGVAIAVAVEFVLRRLRAGILSFIGARTEFAVGTTIFQRIMALPAWSTEQAAVGTQVARIKDFESMRDMFVGPLALLFYELPATIVFLLVLGFVNPWMILVIAGSVAAFAVLWFATQQGMSARVLASSRASSQRGEFLSDSLTKMRAVKYAGAEARWFERFRALSARAVANEFASQQYASRVAMLAQAVGTATVLAALTASIIAALDGAISVGAVVAVMIIMWRVVGPLQSGFLSLTTLFRVFGSVRQIDNLMRLRGDRDSLALRQAPPAFKGDVSFSRVSFRYSQDADPALLGVTFRVPPGKVCAIAGPNGAGKSTVVKLVTGIYVPQAGSVRIDDIDIRQIDPGDLRSLISYAPQRCDVFFGTIAQNLRLVNPLATDGELRWAVGMAGLLDDIEALPDGFHTRVFDGQAEQLPHGFRQRLSLARAYLKPAPVTLFDEPGNALDAEADQAFQRAVAWLRGRSTVLLVSHRPSHLRLADMIVYMEDGYVRQVGTWEQVSPLIMGNMR